MDLPPLTQILLALLRGVVERRDESAGHCAIGIDHESGGTNGITVFGVYSIVRDACVACREYEKHLFHHVGAVGSPQCPTCII